MTVNSQLAEKGLDSKVIEKNRLQGIAEKYKSQGFEVVIEPSKSLLPFDLGNYCQILWRERDRMQVTFSNLKTQLRKSQSIDIERLPK